MSNAERAEQRRLDADAALRRRADAAARELQLQQAREEAARQRRAAKRDERAERDAEARQRQAERGAAWSEWAPVVVRRAMLVAPIAGPMAVAWIGQMGFATKILGWPLVGAVLFAAAWELSTVYVGWLAFQARQDGDPARLLRVMTWVFASAAATMNYWHVALDWRPNPVAVSYGAMSLAGITLWELYATWQHRRSLRAAGMAPRARPRFGGARWLRYPVMTWRAWSVAVRDDLNSAPEALARARAEEANDQPEQSQTAHENEWSGSDRQAHPAFAPETTRTLDGPGRTALPGAAPSARTDHPAGPDSGRPRVAPAGDALSAEEPPGEPMPGSRQEPDVDAMRTERNARVDSTGSTEPDGAHPRPAGGAQGRQSAGGGKQHREAAVDPARTLPSELRLTGRDRELLSRAQQIYSAHLASTGEALSRNALRRELRIGAESAGRLITAVRYLAHQAPAEHAA